jgi:hypothetical protein
LVHGNVSFLDCCVDSSPDEEFPYEPGVITGSLPSKAVIQVGAMQRQIEFFSQAHQGVE